MDSRGVKGARHDFICIAFRFFGISEPACSWNCPGGSGHRPAVLDNLNQSLVEFF
jgi:hypothetical protein